MHINFNKVPLKADPTADSGSTNLNSESTSNKAITKDLLKAIKETDATKEHANLKFNFDQAISNASLAKTRKFNYLFISEMQRAVTSANSLKRSDLIM